MTPEQIAELMKYIQCSIEEYARGEYEGVEFAFFMLMLKRQQQIVEYLLERDRQREGDGK